MASSVRSLVGGQGSGGLTTGGDAAASRTAPADGASFSGILGSTVVDSAQALDGSGNRNGSGKGDSKAKSDDQNPTSTDGETALLADVAQSAYRGLGNLASAPDSGGKDSVPAVTGASASTSVSGSSRKKWTSANIPAAQGQLAMAVFAPSVPSAASSANGGAAAGGGTVAPVAADASQGTASRNTSTQSGSAMATMLQDQSPSSAGNRARNGQELDGLEDGSSPQEPDGIGPATAGVGRPAAMVLSGPPVAVSPPLSAGTADNATADDGGSASDDSIDQPVGPANPTAFLPSADPPPPALLAAASLVDRGPARNAHAPLDGATPVQNAAGGGSAAAFPSGVLSGGVAPSALPGSALVASGAAASVGVVATDGTSQPLGSALAPQVLAMISAGRNQMTVHLNPPDLGSLTVRIEVQAHDVSAWFGSSQPQVQQAVSDALAQLHGSLNGVGLNLTGAWVGADVSGGRGQQSAGQLPLRRIAVPADAVEQAPGDVKPTGGLSVYV